MTGLVRRVIAWMQPVDLHTVCRDDQLIEAIRDDDLDTAHELADEEFVNLLVHLHALRGAA